MQVDFKLDPGAPPRLALKRNMRLAMRLIGRDVVKEARKLAVSGGAFPKKRSGALRRAVSFRVSSGGFYVKIIQKMPKGAKVFYPGMLQGKPVNKADWVALAKDARQAQAVEKIRQALRESP